MVIIIIIDFVQRQGATVVHLVWLHHLILLPKFILSSY